MFLDNLKFFKTPRNKQFNYRPRYYDEQKEDLQRRVDAARQDAGHTADYSRDALRSRIDFRAQRRGAAARPNFMSNFRVLFIAALLLLTVYFINKYL